MRDKGYEVDQTKKTRDGGVDIFAIKKDEFGKFLTVVDCKKYSPERIVGVDMVRSIFGIVELNKASHGMLVTTSRFSGPALDLARIHQYRVSLKDFEDLKLWLIG